MICNTVLYTVYSILHCKNCVCVCVCVYVCACTHWMAIFCDFVVFSRYENGWRRRREGVPLGNWLWKDLVSLCNIWLLVLVCTLFRIVAFKTLEDIQDFKLIWTYMTFLHFIYYLLLLLIFNSMIELPWHKRGTYLLTSYLHIFMAYEAHHWLEVQCMFLMQF